MQLHLCISPIDQECFKLLPRPLPPPKIEKQSFKVELQENLYCQHFYFWYI